MKKTFAIAALALFATSSLALSASSVSNVPSGQITTIESLVSWDANCQSVPDPSVRLRRVSHGQVFLQQGTAIVPSTPEAGRCAGATVRATKILYQSEAGFRGQAEIDFLIRPANINKRIPLRKIVIVN